MSEKQKSPAYWEGHAAETRRIAAKDAVRAVLDAHPNVSDLAQEVGRQFARDNARKQGIIARSPHLARAVDAEELAGMSSRELAEREISELGIKPDGRSVEEQLLDAHHAGRDFVRNGGILGGMGAMKGGEAAGRRLIGGASDAADAPTFMSMYLGGMDSAETAGESFLDNYLNAKE
jgi:hypothetical protein